MSTAKHVMPCASLLAVGARPPLGLRPYRERRSVAVRRTLLASSLILLPPAVTFADEAAEAMPPVARESIPDGTAVRVLGRDVKGPSGQVVAQVVNVLVDSSGRPLAAILDYGGFMGVGKRRVAVAWRALSFVPGGTPGGGSGITLGLTRDQLKGFPDHKDGEPIVVAAPPVLPGIPEPASLDSPPSATDPK